ncbi:MAG: ABC transporter permease [Gordonia sp. (in: high G+C Gram-positive bacteria)]|uniref:ABC transporter permease n=1 Tax=Gordonia sp. (in: high G+C Gram-positive bacteria) TaxID=84139 RepID=UPI0039E49626
MTTTAAQTAPAPAQTTERSLGNWLRNSLILAGRQLGVTLSDVPTLIQIIAVPVVTMLLFKVVFGDVVGQASGQDSVYGTVPLVVLVSAMFGSVASAVRLNNERRTGLLARLHVLPINRGAELTSRLLTEVLRVVVITVVLLAVGAAIGFRFTQGLLPALGLVLVAVLFGLMFSIVTLTLAINGKPGSPIVPIISLLSSLLMFFNSGFTPVDQYPKVLQPFVEHQPMTPAINAMNHLATGGPVAGDLLTVLAWTVGAILVFTYPAVRGYRRAAVGR